MKKQGKFAAYMWNHGGIVIRPHGMAGKMHIEIRGKAAYTALVLWAGAVGGLVYEIVRAVGN